MHLHSHSQLLHSHPSMPLQKQQNTLNHSNNNNTSSSTSTATAYCSTPSRTSIADEHFFNTDNEVLQQLKNIEFGVNARHSLFELRDSTVFTNHGSYGTCPSYVLSKQH